MAFSRTRCLPPRGRLVFVAALATKTNHTHTTDRTVPQLATPLSWEDPLDRWLCVFVFRRICLFQSAGILLAEIRSRKLSPMSDLSARFANVAGETLPIDSFLGDRRIGTITGKMDHENRERQTEFLFAWRRARARNSGTHCERRESRLNDGCGRHAKRE